MSKEKIAELKRNYSNIKIKVVGYPLAASSEFFKEQVTNVLGFQWLLPSLSSSSIPHINVSLPSFKYFAGDLRQTNYTHAYMGDLRGYEPYLYSGIFSATQQYTLNPVNFLFVGLNYFSRNLGKALGLLVASPFTIPAYLCIKSYFSLKIGIEMIADYFSVQKDPININTNSQNDEDVNSEETESYTDDDLSEDEGMYIDLFPKKGAKSVRVDTVNDQDNSLTANYLNA